MWGHLGYCQVFSLMPKTLESFRALMFWLHRTIMKDAIATDCRYHNSRVLIKYLFGVSESELNFQTMWPFV